MQLGMQLNCTQTLYPIECLRADCSQSCVIPPVESGTAPFLAGLDLLGEESIVDIVALCSGPCCSVKNELEFVMAVGQVADNTCWHIKGSYIRSRRRGRVTVQTAMKLLMKHSDVVGVSELVSLQGSRQMIGVSRNRAALFRVSWNFNSPRSQSHLFLIVVRDVST
ncbi:uncharacterized protein LY89DRAFT_501319 [Mollisia scopiformis]|uniref:Uncharacterized protein n=1 Tax=Mollisia scopiformis TaxID=149040 RepID=A0A194XER1_MOLSC|nr:uncharacterized protein LY89DRAFT_501319 [Mollisia scopiformis]KUJ18663.1 hypothetical protein LY89DRAFT_501319 [Mollisia scopiformis]